MRFFAVILIAVGLGGAAIIGIGRGVPPWQEPDFIKMNIGDMHHALALISAASIIAMSLIPPSGSRWHVCLTWLTGILFFCSTGILLFSMCRLDERYWMAQPFLSFAILMAGGLITLAIEARNDANNPHSETDETPE